MKETDLRRLAEAGPLAAETRYRNLVETIPIVIYTAGVEPTGPTLYISPQIERLLGFSPEEMLADPQLWERQLHPDDRERVLTELAKSHNTRAPFQSEYRMLDRDGHVRWFRDEAAVVRDEHGRSYLQGAMIDVTAQKHAEAERERMFLEALTARGEAAQVREVLTQVFDGMSEAVVALDREWRFAYVSPKASEVVGRPASALLGKQIWTEFPEIAGHEFHRACQRAVAEQAPQQFEAYYPFWARWGEARIYPSPDGLTCFFADITERKLREARLQEALEAGARQDVQLRHLLSSSPTTIYALRIEDESLVPTLVSENVTRVLGYTCEEVMAPRFFSEHVHPEDREAVAGTVRQAFETGHAVCIYRFRHPDGSYRWVQDEMRLLRDETGRPVEAIGAWSDITEKRRAEEERLRLLHVLEQSLNEVYLFDAETLRFQYVNRGALKNLGYSLEEVQAKTPVDLEPEFDETSFRRLVQPLLDRAQESLVFETLHRRANGTTYAVEVHLQLVEIDAGRAFLAVINDMTERDRAEQALRESERRFRGLIENAPDAIVLVGIDGGVLYGSPAATRTLGYEPKDYLGHQAIEFVHPDDEAEYRERLAICLASPGEPVRAEIRVRHRDGGWRLLRGYLTNLLAEAGIGAIVVNYRDVTQERHLEEQLLQAQKLESVGRLAGGIAHDFNNLLTAVLGYTEILEEEATDGRVDLGALAEIRRAGERARDLTGQLLSFARRQMIAPRRLDLNAVVLDSRRLLRRLIGEDVEIATRLAPDLWAIEADVAQIEQAIVNLAVNARDAMPQGGRLSIETANVLLDEEYAALHPGVSKGAYVALVATDTGEGMSEETRARIFEPFFTTKPAGLGTGLGLSTVYGVVRQSGGHIWVESEPGRGTTFRLYFPRASGEPDLPAEPFRAPQHPGSETVLLVEDDTSVRELTVRALEAGGYRVLVATDGAEALALAERLTRRVDLLVTDVVMPGMGGRQVADSLSARWPGLKVLYVSGYTQDAVLHDGVLDSSLEFLGKPFTPTVLLARVRELLD